MSPPWGLVLINLGIDEKLLENYFSVILSEAKDLELIEIIRLFCCLRNGWWAPPANLKEHK